MLFKGLKRSLTFISQIQKEVILPTKYLKEVYTPYKRFECFSGKAFPGKKRKYIKLKHLLQFIRRIYMRLCISFNMPYNIIHFNTFKEHILKLYPSEE